MRWRAKPGVRLGGPFAQIDEPQCQRHQGRRLAASFEQRRGEAVPTGAGSRLSSGAADVGVLRRTGGHTLPGLGRAGPPLIDQCTDRARRRTAERISTSDRRRELAVSISRLSIAPASRWSASGIIRWRRGGMTMPPRGSCQSRRTGIIEGDGRMGVAARLQDALAWPRLTVAVNMSPVGFASP